MMEHQGSNTRQPSKRGTVVHTLPPLVDEDANDKNAQLHNPVKSYTFVRVQIDRSHPDLAQFVQNEGVPGKDLLDTYLNENKIPVFTVPHIAELSLSVFDKEPMAALLDFARGVDPDLMGPFYVSISAAERVISTSEELRFEVIVDKEKISALENLPAITVSDSYHPCETLEENSIPYFCMRAIEAGVFGWQNSLEVYLEMAKKVDPNIDLKDIVKTVKQRYKLYLRINSQWAAARRAGRLDWIIAREVEKVSGKHDV